MLSIKNALTIDGWLTSQELEWLAVNASLRDRIVEVGSWLGRSTRALADNTPGIVYAVDTWRGGPEEQHLLINRSGNWLEEQFAKNVEDLLPGPVHKVRPVQLTSHEAADYLGNHYRIWFDMVFLDAAKDYNSVHSDILTWRALLAPRGMLCGADCDSQHMGVVNAVRELYPHFKRGAGNIWIASDGD